MMRLQILGDPNLMRQLQEVHLRITIALNLSLISLTFCNQTHPEIAEAAQSNSSRFAELLGQTRARQYEIDNAQQREIEALNANPFDVEAQRRIEETIRQQAVMENMDHAIEYSPESFGRVTMLQ